MTGEKLRKLFGKVTDWVYPPLCVSCGKPGAMICEECLSKLPPVGEHFCITAVTAAVLNFLSAPAGRRIFMTVRFQR